ncbi:MAG: hypothetical protein RIS47_1557, partial [Bacteroidota bacterium]
MLFRYILLILLCSPSYIWAQRTINNQDPENENANKLRDNKPEAKDTTHFRLRAYYTDDNNHTVYSALDTMLLGKQRYRERDAYAPSWTTLANYGHAALPNTYFDRKVPQDFLFWTPFQYYWKPVEEEFIYNINKPFTDLYLSKSGKALVNEQRVGLIHSRNFTPRFNVGLRYQVLSTAGSLGHRSKSKHTNFGFVAAYQGLRYKSQFKISKIGITNQLNGGFKPGNFYFDSDSITPQLNTAGEKIGKTDIYLDHEYLIGAADTITHKQLQLPMLNAKASIRHRFKYEHNSRVFYDSQLNYTDSKLDYYPKAIYDTNATY